MSNPLSNPHPEPRAPKLPTLILATLIFATLLLAVGLGMASPSAASPDVESCHPPTEIRERLNAHDPYITGCRPDLPCWEGVPEALRALVESHPDVLRVQTSYLRARRYMAEDAEAREALADEYRKAAEAEPENADAQYLLGQALWGKDEGREALERALELDPDYAPALLSLSALDTREEPERAAERLQRFRQLCPDHPAGVLSVGPRLPKTLDLPAPLDVLRQEIRSLPAAEQLRAHSNLWALEFARSPVQEHAALRERIATEDLKRLEALDWPDRPLWWQTLESGYEVAGLHEKLAELNRRRAEQNPCEQSVLRAALEELGADKKGKGPEAYAEMTEDEARALLAGYEELDRRCPGDWMVQMSLFGTAAEMPETVVSNERLLEMGTAYLESRAEMGSRVRSSRPAQWVVAKALLERETGLEKVAEWLAEARQEMEEGEKKEDDVPSSMPEEFVKRIAVGKAAAKIDLDLMEGHAQLALGHLDAAQPLLARAREGFDRLAEMPLGNERLGSLEQQYSELRERLAEARGVDPSTLDLRPVEAEEPMEPAELLAALWNELDEPLEPFQLQDLEGRTWTVDDLKGRTTLINIWATWCGPCRAELPHIQELHEEWKERDDVRVITFDMDHSIGGVAPYLEKEGYDFPVLLAIDYLQELGVNGIPQTWLIDARGHVRKKNMGFGSELAEEWVADVKKQVETLGAEAPSASEVAE